MILVSRTDIASTEQVAAVLSRAGVTLPPVRGVIHAAGTLDDGVLLQQNWARFAKVLAAKVEGAWNLHEQTQHLDLDFFVMFSSASALLGPVGQANYAAANSFLDALAHHRHAQGLAALTINWGPWADVGQAAALDPRLQRRFTTQGIGMIAPRDGLRTLEYLLQGPNTQTAVLPIRWSAYLQQFPADGAPLLLSDIAARATPVSPGSAHPSQQSSHWRTRLAEADSSARSGLLTKFVHEQAARVLRLDPARALNPRQPLQEMGLDSLMAVELRNAVAEGVGRTLPATLMFDYPTVEALSGYLGRQADTAIPARKMRQPASGASLRSPGRRTAEPIAIIGAGCRLPGGGDNLESFWQLLRDGVDAITEVPPDRWDIDAYYDPNPDTPGKMYTRWGGFLEHVDRFDAQFFSINPREAVSLDPQQRLLLEVTWEALEHAGQAPDRLQGSPTGVFIGISSYDYYHLQRHAGEAAIDAYTGSGVTFSVAAGRLAYVLGLQGPTMAVDTACSSSLVTVHLACQSLRDGECDLALAGGVNLILSPENTIYSSRLRAMAADGRCKTFDARADGYVRGEGCGIVVLKRLSEAIRDRDGIVAVIRGSAVNQDGRSQGLTAPNGPAQEAVIRKALTTAGVQPHEVGYVEAHGTGTPLGDPIEVQAVGAVLGQGRAVDRPLVLGSLKTNIGHLESAAGVAGLIKAALILQHGEIPPHLHLQERNPYINWQELPVTIATGLTKWPEGHGRRIAGVSAFGYSGTNAHVVLEEAPAVSAAPQGAAKPAGQAQVLPLSARTAAALDDLAQAYRELLADGPPTALRDICHAASVGRTHHEHRLALVGQSADEIVGRLSAFLDQKADRSTSAGISFGVSFPGTQRKVVFVFPGQGSQWLGMGRELLRDEPAFRAAMEECDTAVRAETGWSVLEELDAAEGESRLAQIDVVQPVLFSMQVALAAVWRAWGIKPDAVVGHSMGEVAAAHVAGVLSLDAAAQIICRRSRLLTRVAGRGAMAVVELSSQQAQQALDGFDGRLTVAVSNSPRSTVLAGDPVALQELLETLERRDVFCRRIKVDVASHSPYVDELHEDLLRALEELAPQPVSVPMYSTVTGEPAEGRALDGPYWAMNLREPVRFAQAVERALADGHEVFLEISPHPVLLPAIEDNLRDAGRAFASMRREDSERATLLGTLGALYAGGHSIDWRLLYTDGGESVRLPTYPWQRQRFWITDQYSSATRQSSAARATSMLGTHVESSAQPGTHLWEQELSVPAFPWLPDHRVQGLVVLPAAAYLELVLAGAEELFGTRACVLRDVAFREMLIVPDGQTLTVQLAISAGSSETATFQVMSRQPGVKSTAQWMLHARGTLRLTTEDSSPAAVESVAAIQARCPDVYSGAELYLAMERRGLTYGPSFQGAEQAWRGDGESFGLVHLPQTAATRSGRYGIHPALLDSCFHTLALAAPDTDGIYVPIGLRELRVHERSEHNPGGAQPSSHRGRPGAVRWSHARIIQSAPADAETLTADLRLLDERGEVVMEARGLQLRRLDSDERQLHQSIENDWLYELQWLPRSWSGTEPGREGRWLIFAGRTGIATSVSQHLDCDLVHPGTTYVRGAASFVVNPQRPEDFSQLLQDVCGDGVFPYRGIVHLWSLDAAPADQLTPYALNSAEDLVCLSTLHLVQALAQTGWRDAPPLWLVTQGAQTVLSEDGPAAVAQAPLWGLAGTIAYEHPELACRRIDLDPQAPGALDAFFRELGASDGEDQVALRGDARYVARLARAERDDAGKQQEALEPAGHRPFRLELHTAGALDGLQLRAAERGTVGSGDVEIEVCAAGLNFLDVLVALGALPSDPPSLGGECAGRIARVGEGVDDLTVGQEVVALAPWSFGRFAIAQRSLVALKPAHLSFEEATTIPVAFLTAYYALHHVARLMPGERVLIHAASGGVGLAAVQIARRIGAEIFATAGSPEKREWLNAVLDGCVHHVMDSRSLAFVDDVREKTGGDGVDVVLNSLSGEFIAASLDLLRDYGRFVEIGKRDYYANQALGMRPFLRNLSFSLVDLRGMTVNRPQMVRALLAEVLQLVETGQLQPISHRVVPIGQADEAFRLMARGKHTGKIVFSLRDPERVPIARAATDSRFHADRTYLITGGLGGLGLTTARWMIEQGARHLILLGRSTPSQTAAAELAQMREMGTTVMVAQADVARREDVAAVLSEAERTMPPLAGILHAAGVLEDGILTQLDRGRFRQVTAPKIAGAWNLHVLTRGQPLAFFVMYSSASSLLGSPGQGNYAAANAFLDALAYHRRAQGLPALSINWGPWADVGLAAARVNRGQRLALAGVGSIAPAQGMRILGRLLRGRRAQVGVLPLNLRQWRQSYPQLAETPLLSGILQHEGGLEEGQAEPNAMRAALVASAPSERIALLEAHLQDQMSRVVRLPAAQLDSRTSFKNLGLDSLMALELRNRLEASLGLTLPVTMVFGYPTVTALAAHLMTRLQLPGDAGPEPPPSPRPAAQPPALDRISHLSDEEVDRVLAARAGRKGEA
jgi:acyl transferase domain-containing protein/acyl carrier protein